MSEIDNQTGRPVFSQMPLERFDTRLLRSGSRSGHRHQSRRHGIGRAPPVCCRSVPGSQGGAAVHSNRSQQARLNSGEYCYLKVSFPSKSAKITHCLKGTVAQSANMRHPASPGTSFVMSCLCLPIQYAHMCRPYRFVPPGEGEGGQVPL